MEKEDRLTQRAQPLAESTRLGSWEGGGRRGHTLTCRGALVGHRGAGAAAVHVGGLGRQGARAASRVIQVLLRLGVHQAGGSLKGGGSP